MAPRRVAYQGVLDSLYSGSSAIFQLLGKSLPKFRTPEAVKPGTFLRVASSLKDARSQEIHFSKLIASGEGTQS